ncbi:hypothetical protein A1D17_10365 [Pseudomonas fluorescens]|uniref:Uncharacterized protein n=1 Tax=Pseudomonas fluorescens TaxID=294 RepID=A0A162BJF5_PSEFL|nr:hypothetical protein A1D17_10365 [Pseudomonas fluorescens]
MKTSTPLLRHSYQGLKNQQVGLTRLRLWLDFMRFYQHEELLLANVVFPAARNGIATRDCVRRLKKGVRLWLFAMAKG